MKKPKLQEYPIGEIITIDDGTRLKVAAKEGCDGCYFSPHYPTACYNYNCCGTARKDKTYVNFVRVGA